MKNKMIFLMVIFVVYGMAVGNGAAQSSAPVQPVNPERLSSETILPALRAKLDQARAALSESRELLNQETKILAGTREQKDLAKKNETALKDYQNTSAALKRETENAQDRLKEFEKELAEQTKRAERYRATQAEFEKVLKDRLDAETRAQQAEGNLAVAQKNLTELKGKLTEAAKRTAEFKKRADDLEKAKEALAVEKTRRAENLARAEKAAALAAQAEKERLALASQLTGIEQKLSAQAQDSSAQTGLETKIAKEKQTIAEAGEKIKKEEATRKETEKAIGELKARLKECEKTARANSQKEDKLKRRQAQYADAQKQRVEAEGRRLAAVGKLQESSQSLAELKTMVADAEKQSGKETETAKAIAGLTDEIKKETALANEAVERRAKQNLEIKKLVAEKEQLDKDLLRARERVAAQAQNAGKLNEAGRQLAEQKELTAKAEASLKDSQNTASAIKQEIKTAQDQAKEIEKELAAQARQGELCRALQAEFEATIKSRVDAETRAQQAEGDLAAAQKNLTELKDKLAGMANQVNEARKQADDLEKTRAALETEKARRTEALTRAEKIVAQTEQSEKKRMALANQLAENEQKLSAQAQDSSAQTGLEAEIAKEKQAIAEIDEKIKTEEATRKANEKSVEELKAQLKECEKTARLNSQREEELKRLQSQYASAQKQRVAAESRQKEADEKLRASDQSLAELKAMLADAARRAEKDKETAGAIASLTDAIKKETASAEETARLLDQQNRALEKNTAEKEQLGKDMLRAREQLTAQAQNANRLDEIKAQLAARKKLRMENDDKLQQIIQKQGDLAKENEQLKIAVKAVEKQVDKNGAELKAVGEMETALQQEKKLVLKYAGLIQEKEQNVQRLDDDKTRLQQKLAEANAGLARQKEQAKAFEEVKRMLNDEKEKRLAAEKKYAKLVRAEKKNQSQVKALKSESSSMPAAQPAAVPPLLNSDAQIRGAGDMAENTGKDALAAEQAVLNEAQADGVRPSAPAVSPPVGQEKKAKPASRRSQLAQAEEHYELGIQKWDEGDLNGAIAEFNETVRLNPDAAGAYYNISLACFNQGNKEEAADYAYKAGECYLKINNPAQATRMAALLMKIDQNSPLIPKLRSKFPAASQ